MACQHEIFKELLHGKNPTLVWWNEWEVDQEPEERPGPEHRAQTKSAGALQEQGVRNGCPCCPQSLRVSKESSVVGGVKGDGHWRWAGT